MSTTMSIKHPALLDSSALEELLHSLPLKPLSGTISYVASGITPLTPDDQDLTKYLSYCKTNSIIPFSKTDLYFDITNQYFLPSGITFDGLYNHNPDVKKSISSHVITGGKPHQINIQFNNNKSAEYTTFLNDLIPQLRQNYSLNHADLWLKASSGGYDHQYLDSNLIINNRALKNKIDLNIGDNLLRDQDKHQQLITWFTALQEKYR